MIAQLLVPLGFKGGLATPASSSSANPKTNSISQQFPTFKKTKKIKPAGLLRRSDRGRPQEAFHPFGVALEALVGGEGGRGAEHIELFFKKK